MKKVGKRKIIILTIFALCIAFLSTGCSKRTGLSSDTTYPDAKVGVIVTTSVENGTYITGYNGSLQQIYQEKWRYGNVSGYGFYSPHVVNGIDYEIALGFGFDKKYGAILGIDIINNKITEYHFNRTNITNLYVDEDYIYVISNCNYTTYLDRYSFKDKTINSIEIKEKIALDFAISDSGEIYMFEDSILYSTNFTDKQLKERIDFNNDISDVLFLHVSGDKLYVTYHNKPCLLVINLSDFSYSDINLQCQYKFPCNCAAHIIQDGKYLFIADADPISSPDTGGVTIFDMKKNEVVNYCEMKHGIYQLAYREGYLYVLDFSQPKMYKYKFQQDNFILEEETTYDTFREKGNYHISGFWVV